MKTKQTLQCNPYGGCPGAASGTNWANNCYPYVVWSGTSVNSSHYLFALQNGGLDQGTWSLDAASVRCVPDLNYRQQLCDRYSGYGALQCQKLSGGCPGSADNNCWPNGVWSGNIASGTNYHIFWLNSGSFNSNTNPYTLAGGVRCVPDLKFLEAKEVFRDEDRQKDCLTFI
ncbi:MAG: hypothetical protein OSJ27_07195 [Candidatus Gastranaerophilales bacterium]|nr:hypothetical protein [Candidatus Gastranaerophilales bacterium]